MQFFAERFKIIVEPTGCLGLAGAMFSDLDIKGSKVGIIVSGGNIDLENLARVFSTELHSPIKLNYKND